MASREQNEAVAGLLKQTLARGAGASGACLEPEMLAAYVERSLGAEEAKACDAHLSECAACREQLAAMLRADESGEAEARDRERQRRRSWMLDWRWLTAAAAVVVLVAVWMARKPEEVMRGTAPANAPTVAMRKAEPASSSSSSPSTQAETSRPEVKRVEPNAVGGSGNEFAIARKPNLPGAPGAKKALQVPAPMAGPVSGRPESRAETSQSQAGDFAGPANQISNAPGERDAGQATFDAEQRAGASSREFVMPQAQQQQNRADANQVSRGAMVAQAKEHERQRRAAAAAPPPVASTVTAPSPAISGTPSSKGTTGGVVGGIGAGAGGGARAAQAKPAPTAKTQDALQAELKDEKTKAARSVAKTRLAEANAEELQAVEQRASGKVIDTPVPNVKWRFDTAGFVERTVDGGATWNGQEVDPAGGLVAASAPSDKICWVVGRNGVAYVTKDAVNWTKVKPPEAADLVGVSARSASSATVTTADGRRFSTHNGGKKWKMEAGTKDSNPR